MRSIALNVSGLDMDEALELFQQIVGCENLYSNPRIGEHAKDVVDVLRARPSIRADKIWHGIAYDRGPKTVGRCHT